MAEERHRRTFRPRARLLLLLGDELIRDEAMAVFELVKNAFDADASTCLIELRNISSDDPDVASIVVEDDGVGMNLDTVTNVWMEPGTDNRKVQRGKKQRTEKYGRLPIGEKGVGRFAVHKLGLRTQITTRCRGSDEVIIDVNWSAFESEEYLSDVSIEVRTRSPATFSGNRSGTRIEITRPRGLPWSRRKVRWLYRSIASINSPFADESSFVTEMEVHPESDWLKGLISPHDVLDRALFTMKGVIKGDHLSYSYHFNPSPDLEALGLVARKRVVKCFPLIGDDLVAPDGETPKRISFREQLPTELADERSVLDRGTRLIPLSSHRIGDVLFSFNIYDLATQVLKRLEIADLSGFRTYLDENGGVRVYRNGIRVYDFGELGNDWLDIEGRRVNDPAQRIGNNQILGAVHLDLGSSGDLVDKTNREGFVENQAYADFRAAVQCAVAQAAAERNIDKERIRRVLKKAKESRPVLDSIEDLRTSLAKQGVNGDITPIVDRIEYQYRQISEDLLLAAGTGLNLASVIHQLDKELTLLINALNADGDRVSVLEIANRLSEMTDAVSWVMRDSPKANLPVRLLIDHVLDMMQLRFEAHQVTATNGFALKTPDPEFSVKGSRRLLSTTLLNLIDNSIYWLDSIEPPRKLYVGTTYELAGRPAIVVADNGPGIVDSLDDLTRPFFTRKRHGTGLGLHIASEVMKNHGGRIAIADPGEVSLPKGLDGAILLLEFRSEA